MLRPDGGRRHVQHRHTSTESQTGSEFQPLPPCILSPLPLSVSSPFLRPCVLPSPFLTSYVVRCVWSSKDDIISLARHGHDEICSFPFCPTAAGKARRKLRERRGGLGHSALAGRGDAALHGFKGRTGAHRKRWIWRRVRQRASLLAVISVGQRFGTLPLHAVDRRESVAAHLAGKIRVGHSRLTLGPTDLSRRAQFAFQRRIRNGENTIAAQLCKQNTDTSRTAIMVNGRCVLQPVAVRLAAPCVYALH